MSKGVGVAIGVGLGLVSGGLLAGVSTALGLGLLNAGLAVGLSGVSSALAQRELKNQKLAPRDILLRGGNLPQIVIYGETVVGGVLMYGNQLPIGNDDYELWFAICHAGHECEEVLGVYYENTYLEFGTEINVSTGNVESGAYYKQSGSKYAVQIWRYDGTQATANSAFVSAFADIDSNFIAPGYCWTLHRWTRWQETEEMFSGISPQNVRAHIKGRKVYNPDLDSSPGNDPTNASYQAYSANSILCAADYMRTYWNVPIPDSRFDWDDIAAQATISGTTVSTPSGNQGRYSCNGGLSLGDPDDDNLQAILTTCIGWRGVVNGLIRLRCGGYVTPDVTITEDDIIGPVRVRMALPREDRYNRMTGTYNAASAKYVQTEFQPVEESTFVTRDNGETINKPLQLDMVTDEYQAQRIAFFLLQQSDQQIIAEIPLWWSGLRLTPGTYCSVTYAKFNWSSKVFRCEALKIQERGVPVVATLREDSSSAWTDPVSPDDYTQVAPDGSITKPAESTPAPTNFVANQVIGAIRLDCTPPSTSYTWDYLEWYASTNSSWSSAIPIGRTITGSFLHTPGNALDPCQPGEVRYYWVRAFRNGVASLRDPNSDTSTVTETMPLTARVNLMNPPYADFAGMIDTDLLPAVGPPSGNPPTYSISTTQAVVGDQSLRALHTGGGWNTLEAVISFSKTLSNSDLPIKLGKQWLLTKRQLLFVAHFYLSSGDPDDIDITFGLDGPLLSGQAAVTDTANLGSFTSGGEWVQIAFDIATAHGLSTITGGRARAHMNLESPNAGSTASFVLYIGGLMLLDVSDIAKNLGDV